MIVRKEKSITNLTSYWLLKLLVTLFACGLVLAGGLAFGSEQITKIIAPPIDMSNMDASNKVLKIKGPWEFYWKELLEPGAYSSKAAAILPSVGPWNKITTANGQVFEPYGYATYRLRMKNLQPKIQGYEFLMNWTLSSHRVSVYPEARPQERSESFSGQVHPEHFIPSNQPSLIRFFPKADEIWVIDVQVANYARYRGGMIAAVKISADQNISRSLLLNQIVAAIGSGILLSVAIYSLLLFFRRRSDRPSLMLFAMAFMYILRSLWESNVPFASGVFSYELMSKFEFIPLAGTPFFYLMFMHFAFRAQSSQKLVIAVGSLGVGLILLALVTPVSFYSPYLYLFQMNIGLYILIGLIIIVRAILARAEGAWLVLIGVILISVAAVHDIFVSYTEEEVVFITKYAVSIFFILQSQLVAKRAAQAYVKAEQNAEKLEHLTQNLQVEIDKQTHELRKQKKEIEDSHIRLQRLDRQKTRFFQNISHEIRTPLTLILHANENQIREQPNNTSLQVAYKNSKRLFRLFNQLLDFQKLESGQPDSKLYPIDLIAFMRVCSKYFHSDSIAGKLKIQFSVDGQPLDQVGPDCTMIIQGEIDSLEKICFNYLSNAFKYAPEGSVVELSLLTALPHVRLQVRDYGKGISQVDQRCLFKVFSQVDDSHTREYEGSGLGLALVSELASKMGAVVGVESQEGQGSNFWVNFELFGSYRPVMDLLLVDDEPEIRLLLGEAFKALDIEVRLAEDFSTALAHMRNFRFKCVVSDQNLPGGDGIALLARMAQEQPDCRRLLITGYPNKDVLQQLINDNLVEKVHYKPINLAEIQREVSSFVKQSQVQPLYDLSDGFRIKDWLLEDKSETKLENGLQAMTHPELKGSGETILVVDDLADLRNMICGILQSYNYLTPSAVNGLEGLEKIRTGKPDLVVTDWMMPKLSGPDMIRRLRQGPTEADIPCILLTAKSDEDSRVEGFRLGADAFLGKPFNEIELLSAVKNLLRLKEGERRIEQLNRNLTENVLKRFLPPQLVDDIVSGRKTLDDRPQHQIVTVMFSDLCGFTQSSETIGAQKMASVLNQYLSRMSQVVFDHGGIVDKFIGDGMMMLFGAPHNVDKQVQVQQACECALAMQVELNHLNQSWVKEGVDQFRMRIGINHGPVIIGSFGNDSRSEYTAIGPVVNLASRIEGVAQPGEIYVSESVRESLPKEASEAAGVFELKGISGSLTLYRLLAGADLQQKVKRTG